MRFGYVVALAAALVQAIAALNLTWSPCGLEIWGKNAGMKIAECAVYSAPLCYPGICAAPDLTVDVDVKRIPARVDPETAMNLWILQGTIYSETELDQATLMAFMQLNYTANVYTMDHRGTGRGTLLKCGVEAGDVTQVPACAQKLHKKFGDLSSFSTTSAATDLVTLISKATNGADTIVYGTSSATLLVERLMHLDPPGVTGYVLDGVSTPAGTSLKGTSGDLDFDAVADDFLTLCSKDTICSERFKRKGITATIKHLITKFDKNPKSTCAALVGSLRTAQSGDPPSFILRFVLGFLLANVEWRNTIPPVVYRLLRCAAKDVEVLGNFISKWNLAFDYGNEISDQLAEIVSYSELWTTPSLTQSELRDQFKDTKMNAAAEYMLLPQYCAFSKEKSAPCDKLKVGEYTGDGIIYERDEYWNKLATIPTTASVLLLSGTLDPFNPNKYAKALLDALDGDNKELVTFDYSMGNSIVDTSSADIQCGMMMLASYVQGNGDLSLLDKACVNEMPAFNMTLSDRILHAFLGTDDAYDGASNPKWAVDMSAVTARMTNTSGEGEDASNVDASR